MKPGRLWIRVLCAGTGESVRSGASSVLYPPAADVVFPKLGVRRLISRVQGGLQGRRPRKELRAEVAPEAAAALGGLRGGGLGGLRGSVFQSLLPTWMR